MPYLDKLLPLFTYGTSISSHSSGCSQKEQPARHSSQKFRRRTKWGLETVPTFHFYSTTCSQGISDTPRALISATNCLPAASKPGTDVAPSVRRMRSAILSLGQCAAMSRILKFTQCDSAWPQI